MSYHQLVRMIAAQESATYPNFNPTQFTTVGLPYWSQYDDLGSGIMQLTPPYHTPTAEDIWDWKKNISDGAAVLNGQLGSSGRYARMILEDVRSELQSHGLSTNLGDPWTPAMIVEDAIRGYNGYSFTHSSLAYGLPLLEFIPQRDADGNLDLSTGRVRWVRTPIKLRAGKGDPDYVSNVLRWRGLV